MAILSQPCSWIVISAWDRGAMDGETNSDRGVPHRQIAAVDGV